MDLLAECLTWVFAMAARGVGFVLGSLIRILIVTPFF
jgi:hypothetical protein